MTFGEFVTSSFRRGGSPKHLVALSTRSNTSFQLCKSCYEVETAARVDGTGRLADVDHDRLELVTGLPTPPPLRLLEKMHGVITCDEIYDPEVCCVCGCVCV